MPRDPFITPAALERLNRPTGRAIGLPGEFYTDPEFFADEQRYLFGRSWVFAAATDELAEPGQQSPSPLRASQSSSFVIGRGPSAPSTTCVATAALFWLRSGLSARRG